MKILVIDGINSNTNEESLASTIFLKPDSALLKDNKPFFIPDFCESLSYNLSLVVRINRLGKNIASRFAHRYYDEVTLGVDLYDRKLLDNAIEKGLPWDLAKGFDGSAIHGDFVKIPENGIEGLNFSFQLNKKNRAKVDTTVSESIDDIIAYLSQFYTFKIGDLLFINLDIRGDSLQINQHLEGSIDNVKILDFNIK